MEWRKIPDFPRYSVSDTGEVKNDETGSILKPLKCAGGYLKVMLGPGQKQLLLHRLVAKTFIPNTECKPEVNHKDGDKTNNAVCNLEWATHQENEIHKCRVLHRGTQKEQRQENIKKAYNATKISVRCLETEIAYESAREAERQTGICQASISACARGEQHTAGGFRWEYA